LLRKKVIVENVQITHVSSGTDRTEDGAVPKKMEKPQKPNFIAKTIDKMQADVKEAPAWNLDQFSTKVNVDSIMALLDINSPQKIDSLQERVSLTFGKWDSTFQAIDLEKDFQFVETRITSIEPEKLQTLPELENAYTSVKKSVEKIDSLETSIKNLKTDLSSDLNTTKDGISLVDNWIKADVNNALSKAKLPSFDTKSVAMFLFGSTVTQKAENILRLVNTSRSFAERFKSDKPKKEKPKRQKGQWIIFSSKQVLPNWWFKNIELSGHMTTGLKIQGTLTNLVSNQKVIGQPTVLNISGARADAAALQLDAEFNYLDAPMENVNIAVQRVPLHGTRISQSEFLPGTIQSGLADVNASLALQDSSMNGRLTFIGKQLALDMGKESQKTAAKIVQRVVSSTDYVDVKARVQSQPDNVQFSVNSNLDDLLVNELKSMAGAEVEAARKKIVSRVEQETEKYKNQYNQFVAQNTERLNTEMQRYQEKLDEYKKMIDAKEKELQERIEEEKEKGKNKVTDELKKRTGGLF